MSNFTKTHFYTQDLIIPDVKIVQCGYVDGMDSWNFGNCCSPFWYLWRNAHSGGHVEFSGKKIELSTDFFLLIPPFTQFSTSDYRKSLSQLYIHFMTGSFLRAVKREPIIIPASAMDPRPVQDFFDDLKESTVKFQPSALKLYGIVYKALERIPQTAYLSENETGMDERVTAALKYISGHFREKHVYETFCKTNRVSVNHLIRLFRRDVGVTPMQYQMGRRIHEARNLLLCSGYSIDEVAEHCGFADRYHFSKAFKKFTGAAPAAYRKNSSHNLIVFRGSA